MKNRTAFHKDEGLLWFDDNPGRDLAAKVGQAARHYRKKYGTVATLCYVHPSALSDGGVTVGGVEVRARATVLAHHFWVGVATLKSLDAQAKIEYTRTVTD